MADAEVLEQALTKNESKIYMAMLELGQTTSGPLIKKTGIHSSKVYEADMDRRKDSFKTLIRIAGKNKSRIIDCAVNYIEKAFDNFNSGFAFDINDLKGTLDDFGIKIDELSKENLKQLIDTYRTSDKYQFNNHWVEATDLLKRYAEKKDLEK